jgi:hypothetical protein
VKLAGSTSNAPGVMPAATYAPPSMPSVNSTRHELMLPCTKPLQDRARTRMQDGFGAVDTDAIVAVVLVQALG